MCHHLFNPKTDRIKYKQESKIIQNKKTGILDTSCDPCIITFPELSKIDFIRHGFSTRLGGISKEHLATMNLSFTRGDDVSNVKTNYNRICRSIGIDPMDLVFSDQIHDTKIHLVTEKDRGKGILQERDLTGMDGLITNIPNLPLVTFYADCVPLYFVDTKKKAIGLSHSGWKGTVNKMGEKTIQAMTEAFDSNPADIIVVIGPSICKDCYEISEDVAKEFRKAYTKEQSADILEEKSNLKYQLDLWLANWYILTDAGIKEENITVSSLCTCCNSSLFYSHRASNGKRGNLAAFLSINNETKGINKEVIL